MCANFPFHCAVFSKVLLCYIGELDSMIVNGERTRGEIAFPFRGGPCKALTEPTGEKYQQQTAPRRDVPHHPIPQGESQGQT